MGNGFEANRETRTKLDAKEQYFLDRADEVVAHCRNHSAFVFLEAAALLGYLAKAAGCEGSKGYGRFVREQLQQVRPEYATFQYADGNEDLPEQMYYVLRCGLVHSFSLVPDKEARSHGGRVRSIVLCHRNAGLNHLSRHVEVDAAIFVAEDFAEDLHALVGRLFDNARQNGALANHIVRHLDDHPPISST
jgi:hypothetical protein